MSQIDGVVFELYDNMCMTKYINITNDLNI